jgi:hypothetical protein
MLFRNYHAANPNLLRIDHVANVVSKTASRLPS